MKTLNLFWMAFVAVTMSMNFTSCSNEDVINAEDSKEEYVTVGLGCTGEYLDFSESVMGRNAIEELYAIQVTAITEEDIWYDESGEKHALICQNAYAAGIFTSLDNVTINLLKGQKYKFQVGIIINPEKLGTFFGISTSQCNEFDYGTSLVLDELGGKNKDCYYGEYDGYIPEENGDVAISTKRVVYGVKYIAQNLTEGKLDVHVLEGTAVTCGSHSVELTMEEPQHEGIYSFGNFYCAYSGIEVYDDNDNLIRIDNYTSDATLDIKWTKEDGTILPLGEYTVTFKRNVKTTIKIKAENLNVTNGITVTKIEETMVEDDNEYIIEGGEVTEVEITNGGNSNSGNNGEAA